MRTIRRLELSRLNDDTTMLDKIDHIGIVVENLDRAIRQFTEVLGLTCLETKEIKSIGLKTAFFNIGGVHIELLDFTRPIPGIDEIALGKNKGIQHIAFQVGDFDWALTSLIKRGLRVVRGFPREGAHGRVCFFYPEDTAGAMIEICERKG